MAAEITKLSHDLEFPNAVVKAPNGGKKGKDPKEQLKKVSPSTAAAQWLQYATGWVQLIRDTNVKLTAKAIPDVTGNVSGKLQKQMEKFEECVVKFGELKARLKLSARKRSGGRPSRSHRVLPAWLLARADSESIEG